MKYRLTVVRHGETNENRLGIIQGQMDCPLSEVGLGQARALGQRFGAEQEKFTHVFSSDLQRAEQTAVISLDEMAKRKAESADAAAATKADTEATPPAAAAAAAAAADRGGYPKITTDRLLRECCFGEGEGKSRTELSMDARRAGRPLHAYTPPGGETDAELRGRARAFFRQLNARMRAELAAAAATSPFAGTPGVASRDDDDGSDGDGSPHVAVYSHGGWIRVFCDVAAREHRFSARRLAAAERGRLQQVPPNTGVCRFVVELGRDDDVVDDVAGAGMSSRSRVECTMAHDARHLDGRRAE